MAETTKVRIRFDSPDTNKQLASGELADVIANGLVPADLLYTLISRWPRLGVDVAKMHGSTSTSNGPVIDYSGDHTWLGVLQTVTILAVAAGNMVYTYKTIQRGKARTSYQVVYKSLNSTETEAAKKKAAEDQKAIADAAIADLNKAFQKTLEANEALKQRYTHVQFVPEKAEDNTTTVGWAVELEKAAPKPQAPWWKVWDADWKMPWAMKKAVNTADATSDSLGWMSYAYWIFFIGAAVVTGIFGVSTGGIGGVADWLAFGVPLAVGLGVGGMKVANMIRNRNVDREAQNDFNNLARETLLKQEEEAAEKGLEVVPAKKKSLAFTPALAFTVVANAAALTVIGTYVAWQYNMWYVTDFLSRAAGLVFDTAASAIGVGIFVTALVACARMAYNAYQNYKANQKAENLKTPAQQQADAETHHQLLGGKSFWKRVKDVVLLRKPFWEFKLDSTLMVENQRKNVDKLEIELLNLEAKCRHNGVDIQDKGHDALLTQAREADARAYTGSAKQNMRNLAHFANFAMTGVFVARTVFVQGVTAFFLPGLAAAVCLSTPWTIGLLVLAGVAWGIYKYVNYRREKNAQKLADANRRIQLVEKKLHILECRFEKAKKQAVKPAATIAVEAANNAQTPTPQLPKVSSTASMAILVPGGLKHVDSFLDAHPEAPVSPVGSPTPSVITGPGSFGSASRFLNGPDIPSKGSSISLSDLGTEDDASSLQSVALTASV